MLTIRLSRIGKKNQPLYRIVVSPKTAPIKGKYTEKLGHYNPHTKEAVIDQKKSLKWLNFGAQPSNTVAKLFSKQGLKHKLIVIKTVKPSTSKKKKGAATEKPQIENKQLEETKIKEEQKAQDQPKSQ